jgi:exodeoxyribonuclease V alpha subunit
MSETTTIIGVFERYRWRSHESAEQPYAIGFLEDNTVVQGPCEDGDLVPGVTYEFYGRWHEHPEHGRSFKFTMFATKVPHSRHGIVAYLQKYCHGIGPVTAARLWDSFGGDSVKVLRTSPELVAALPGVHISLERAQVASRELTRLVAMEDTKIGLTNLFAGRGFPAVLVEECVKKWKVQAPARVTFDPYTLLVNEMSGCGFARCDRLYMDLGLPPERLKRQVICLWHALHADSSGHTWITAEKALERLGQMVSGAKLQRKKAIKIGVRSGWLAKHRDAEGVLWLAEGERAKNEAFVAAKLKELSAWTMADTTEVRTLIEAGEVRAMEMAVA